MSPNLRCDDTFVEDERWHRQKEAYHEFVGKAWGHKLLLLEFGVGFNTPSIIRFPFEQMAASNSNISLVRFNRDHPQLMQENVFNFTCFTEELGVVVKRLSNLRSM